MYKIRYNIGQSFCMTQFNLLTCHFISVLFLKVNEVALLQIKVKTKKESRLERETGTRPNINNSKFTSYLIKLPLDYFRLNKMFCL